MPNRSSIGSRALPSLRTWTGILWISVLAACGGESSTPACTPGQQVGCACPGMESGVQVCRADGSGFDTCACESGSGGAAGTAGAGGTTSSGGTAGSGGSSGSNGSSGSGGTLGEAGPPGTGGSAGAGGSAGGGPSRPDAQTPENPDGNTTSDASWDGSLPPFDAPACVAEPVAAERRSIDLYLMVDNSGSMDMIDVGNTTSRWDSVQSAITGFVNDPQNAGVSVGLDFFPEGGLNASCIVTDYTMPNVAVDVLPGASNMQATAIANAVQGRARSGGTPTVPALSGALQVASTWAQAHAGRDLAIVFLTDGQPTGCSANNNTVAGAVMVAQAGANSTPPVRTYVLGVGPDTGNLDSIAAAGGTKMAYMATGTTTPAVALNSIRKDTLRCDYNMPHLETGLLDFNRVNVMTRVTNGGATYLDRVDGAASCSSGPGWYYDSLIGPTKITLCPSSCSSQLGDGFSVTFELGCATRIRIPPP